MASMACLASWSRSTRNSTRSAHPAWKRRLQVEADQIGLAGAGRKLDQEPAFAQLDRVVEGPHRLLLVRAHRRGSRPGGRSAPGIATVASGLRRLPHLDSRSRSRREKKRVDEPGIVVLVVPEVDQLAVGQEDERRAECLGIGQGLLLRHVRVDGRSSSPRSTASGRPSLVVEHIVGAALVR